MNFEVRYLTEDEFLLWDEFVDKSPQGSIYSKSFWLKSISEITDRKFKILAAFKGGNIFGGIGLCIRKTILGNIISSPLLTPYNSLILREPDTKYPSRITSENLELIREIISKLEIKECGAVAIQNRPSINDIRAFSWNNWDTKVQYTYEIPLFDLDSLKATLAHNVRKQIRKSEETNVQIRTVDDCGKFYSLFSQSLERQNRPVPIKENKFRSFYESLKQHNCCRMYFAEMKSGETVSARITLFTKNQVAHDWVAGASPEYFQTGATPFLLWRIIEDLSQQGYRYLDLNGANIENIAKFKSEFGGRLVPYYTTSKYNSRILKLAMKLALAARRKA
jgi:hypothetical protein